MLDLSSEVNDLRAPIRAAIDAVLDSTRFINGEEVKELEEALAGYLGVKHVITCGNGTDALQIALMASGLKPGEGVITTPFTFIATAEAIELMGLEAQFADIDSDTLNISPEAIEKAITPHTQAIIPVHLFGRTADMEAIMKIADRHDLKVIEDSAQATGGGCYWEDGWHNNGTIGDIGCTSFFPSKNLACYGDGGALFTDDDDLAEKSRMIKNHGSRVKYVNEIIGINSRLDTIQAAILKVKLDNLDIFNENRNRIARYYNQRFMTCEFLDVPISSNAEKHVFHQYTIRVKNGKRDALQEYLSEEKISSAVYYRTPLHLQQAFNYMPYCRGDFPVAEEAAEEVLSLPIHPYLSENDRERVADTVLTFFEKK